MTTSDAKIIKPGSTIAILGGGQLGRMLALAGRNMGYRFITLDPTQDAPCGQVADEQIVAGFDCIEAAKKLAIKADIITYEFENVDHRITEYLMHEAYVPQGFSVLYTTKHRLREKQAIELAGLKAADYVEIKTLQDLEKGVSTLGLPAVLKTATGGYDGKGQWVIHSLNQLKQIHDKASESGTDLILEKFISFEKELSVIVARNLSGEIKTFPPAENIHIDNILHESIVPARISTALLNEAERLALKLAEKLNVIGLLAVELFLTKDEKLIVNELAPRPHNSGHYTQDACLTSQFEQHIRAICNLPLGSTELKSKVVMINILGEHVAHLLEKIDQPDFLENKSLGVSAKVHLYGKKEAKIKRKMGHINLLTTNIESALAWIKHSGIWEKN